MVMLTDQEETEKSKDKKKKRKKKDDCQSKEEKVEETIQHSKVNMVISLPLCSIVYMGGNAHRRLPTKFGRSTSQFNVLRAGGAPTKRRTTADIVSQTISTNLLLLSLQVLPYHQLHTLLQHKLLTIDRNATSSLGS